MSSAKQRVDGGEAATKILIAQPPALTADAPHVWTARISVMRGLLPALEAVLSAEEIERAQRFRVVGAREQFIVGRSVLRHLLAAYVERDARELQFEYGVYGKPSLIDARDIAFSVSHSDDVVLVGVSDGYPIGVDVERMRDDVDCKDIAERYFAATERARYQQAEPGDRSSVFFSYWSRKEAVLKAVGAGLTTDLDAVEVATMSSGRAVRVQRRLAAEDETWFAYDLSVAAGYSAALAARSGGLQPIIMAATETTASTMARVGVGPQLHRS